MQNPAGQPLLSLLLQAYNRPLMDFYYFPDVVLIGKQRIEPESLQALLSNGLIELERRDTFGRFYKLSAKGHDALFTALAPAKTPRRRKRPSGPLLQGTLCFG